MYKGSLMLPCTSTFILMILREYHDSVVGGHSGEEQTCKRLVVAFIGLVCEQ